MSIKYAILGFLSHQPLTGYNLKKMFADSLTFYWSGNNNQIYRTLVDLHRQGLVSQEMEHQVSGPSRKVYTITERGLADLKQWVVSSPELPELRNRFLMQLAWADQLGPEELAELINRYEDEVQTKLVVVQDYKRRNPNAPGRTPREEYLWEMMMENWQAYYEHELTWVQRLRQGLSQIQAGQSVISRV